MYGRPSNYSLLDDDIPEQVTEKTNLLGYDYHRSENPVPSYPQPPPYQYVPQPRPSYYLPVTMPVHTPNQMFAQPTTTPPQRFSITATLAKLRKIMTEEDDIIPRQFIHQEEIREGFGTFIWGNGDKYEGYWQNNQKHGHGMMRWSNGDVYQGHWVNDKREDPRGIYMYRHGLVYEGGYKNDCRNGEGCLMWPDGECFIGTWKDGARVGSGIFVTATGIQMPQMWNESPTVNYSATTPLKFPAVPSAPIGFS